MLYTRNTSCACMCMTTKPRLCSLKVSVSAREPFFEKPIALNHMSAPSVSGTIVELGLGALNCSPWPRQGATGTIIGAKWNVGLHLICDLEYVHFVQSEWNLRRLACMVPPVRHVDHQLPPEQARKPSRICASAFRMNVVSSTVLRTAQNRRQCSVK